MFFYLFIKILSLKLVHETKHGFLSLGQFLILGGILGRSKAGTDGIFPHEQVRRAMEEYGHLNLSRYVFMGELNARGSRWLGDGAEAKANAEKCFANERRFAVDYPETAELWRVMGEDYLTEGRHDHVISEIGLL